MLSLPNGQTGQITDVEIVGNSNNPVSNQTARSMQRVILTDYNEVPAIFNSTISAFSPAVQLGGFNPGNQYRI